jgi:hypothetical protein
MKIGQVRAELLYTDRRRDGQKLRISLLTVFRDPLTRHKEFCTLNKSRADLLLAKFKCRNAVFSTVCIPF